MEDNKIVAAKGDYSGTRMNKSTDEAELLKMIDEIHSLSPSEVQGYLDRRCGQDASLRQKVVNLLKADKEKPDFWEAAAAGVQNIKGEIGASSQLSMESLNSNQQDRYQIKPGQQCGRYQIGERIGEGGMGQIYKAYDPKLDRLDALKSLHNNSFLLTEEGRGLAKCQSPNIVQIYDIGEQDGTPFLVMEYLQGETLRHKIGKLNMVEALRIAIDVATALITFSEKKTVHCDLKPENIMVCNDGTIKVLDLGLAIARGQKAEFGGTIKYMSPEQARKQPLTELSDIFSFGIVLYEMLSGHRPFDRPTNLETLEAISFDEPPPLSNYLQEIPDYLQIIVSKALRKPIDKRYQTAQDMKHDLEDCLLKVEALVTVKEREKFFPEHPSKKLPITTIDPAKLNRYLPPVAISGAMQSPQVFNPLPVDLGTICGLDRSCFIAVIAGTEDDGIFDNLIHVEQCLRYSLASRANPTLSLPERLWLRIDLRNSAKAPANLNELLQAAGHSDRIVDIDFSAIIPGIFIEWGYAEPTENDALLTSIKFWCERLFCNLFRKNQLAIVTHITSHSVAESQSLARKAVEKLSLIHDAPPLSLFHTSNHSSPVPVTESPDDNYFFDIGLIHPPGSYVCSWLVPILKDASAKQRLKKEAENYSQLLNFFNSLLQNGSKNHIVMGFTNAENVVADLARLPSFSQQMYQQFLNFVNTYLPDHTEELLRVYIRTGREFLIRMGLVFAAKRGYLDNLLTGEGDLDALFQLGASQVQIDEEKLLSLLGAHPEVTESLVDKVAYQLLLQYIKYRRQEIKEQIEDLLKNEQIGSPLQTVCNLVLGKIEVLPFISRYGKEAYALALKSGYTFDFWLSEIDGLELDNPDLWGLITALHTSESRISELLKMIPAYRAIFGLCQPEEWQVLTNEGHLLDKITTARQQRPLHFRH